MKFNTKSYKNNKKNNKSSYKNIKNTIIIVSFLFLLSLFSNSVFASYSITFDIINNKISHSETASFYITLQNTGNTTEKIRMNFEDVKWSFRTEPLSYYFSGIELKPGEKKSFPIYLKPSVTLPYNTYLLKLTFYSENTNERTTVTLPVRIKLPGTEIGEYLTAVSKFVEVPLQVDPRNNIPIKINLKNRNPKYIKNFTIIITSNLFNKTLQTELKPLEEKTLIANITLPKNISPQKVNFKVEFIADGDRLTPTIKESFYIKGYEDIKKNVTEEKSFFRITYKYKFKNEGNVNSKVEEYIKTNFFSKPFITILEENNVLKKTTVNNETGTYLILNSDLKPGEEKEYTIIYNYILLFWLIVFLIVGLFVYNMMKSPIEIKKDAVVVGVSEGGISEIRVVLHLKNLTGKRYKNINVVDIIPKLAEFIPEKDDYSQSKVYSNKNEGSIVKWNLDGLEKYEERILTYRIKSKLSILGGLTLPRAILRFTDETGSEQVTRSNTVKITL